MVYRERRSDGTTRLTGAGGSGTPGPPGEEGPVGPEGTRWGTTPAWAFADATDVECEMADGGEPRVGDLLISGNGFASDAVYKITAVYPVTNNVDIEELDPEIRLQGTTGDPGPVPDMGGASSTSLSFATGTKTFALDPALNKAWPMNTTVKVAKLSAPADYMIGYVTACTTTSVTLWVTEAVGAAGTFNAWVLSVGGFRGPQGEQGPQGDEGPAGSVGACWPVGSVFIGYTSTNPATLLGVGTWAAIATGRMLIGVDPGDATMDALGDTGGAKTHTLAEANLPPHTHAPGTLTLASTSGSAGTNTNRAARGTTTDSGDINTSAFHGATGSGAGTSTPVNHLPPYLAVYMWRRTA